MKRTLYLEPPIKANAEGKIWLLNKCPYGISDAGRQWHDRVVEVLQKLEGHQLKLDQAVFVWFFPDKTLLGIIVIHVDDFIFAGHPSFQLIVTKIHSEFTVGTQESVSMKYLGLNVIQTPHHISMDSANYKDIEEIDTSHLGSNDEPLDKNTTRSLRKVSGQINWLASQTRLDLCYDNCIIANSIANATTKDIHYANKIVRKAINTNANIPLIFPNNLDLSTVHIAAFGDASFANLRDKGSQGGHVVLLVDANGYYSIVTWRSKSVKRVVRSTLAAECCAVNDAADAAIHARHILCELLPKSKPPLHLYSDNNALVKAAHSTTPVEEKALQIHIAELRDNIKRREITEFRWVPTEKNLADCLTKSGASPKLLFDFLRHDKCFDITSGSFLMPE